MGSHSPRHQHSQGAQGINSSSVGTKLGSGKRAVAADPWPAIAFGLKMLGLGRGTDRSNSAGPPRGRVCYRTAKYPLLGTYRGAIHANRNLPTPRGCLQSEPVSSAVRDARGDEQ
jgi:hypothetical protein